MLDKLKDALDKGVASVSVKSNVFLETTKISTHIGNIQDKIAEVKRNLAETIYLKWKDGLSYEDNVEAACQEIRKYEGQIDELQQKITQLKLESQQILGEKKGADTSFCCPSCGAVNTETAKFCFKCGARLIDEARQPQ